MPDRDNRSIGIGTALRLLVLLGPGRHTSPSHDRTNDSEVLLIGSVIGVLLVTDDGRLVWNI